MVMTSSCGPLRNWTVVRVAPPGRPPWPPNLFDPGGTVQSVDHFGRFIGLDQHVEVGDRFARRRNEPATTSWRTPAVDDSAR
jgi:hypothetical protein